jgi:uncharacterized protein (DUF58 family)
MSLPTGRGFALLAVAAATYLAARVVGTWELYLLAVGLAVVVLLSWLLVHLTGRRLQGDRRITPAQPIAGDPVGVAVRLRNRSLLPGPQLALSGLAGTMGGDDVLEVEGLGPSDERRVVAPPVRARRGVHRLPAPHATAEDPLGLARLERSFGEPLGVTVVPRLAYLSSCVLFPGMGTHPERGRHGLSAPGASELRNVRPHRPGEPLSRIHWKATARTGSLMLREMDEPATGEVTLLLDAQAALVAGDCPDTNLELAVEVAGSVADFVLRAGRGVSLLLPQDDWRPTSLRPGVEGRARLLESLARVTPRSTLRLGPSLHVVLGRDRPRPPRLHSLALVVLALDDGLVRALLHLRAQGLDVAVLHVDHASFAARAPDPSAQPTVPATLGDAALAAAGVRSVTLRRGDDLRAALSLGLPARQAVPTALPLR